MWSVAPRATPCAHTRWCVSEGTVSLCAFGDRVAASRSPEAVGSGARRDVASPRDNRTRPSPANSTVHAANLCTTSNDSRGIPDHCSTSADLHTARVLRRFMYIRANDTVHDVHDDAGQCRHDGVWAKCGCSCGVRVMRWWDQEVRTRYGCQSRREALSRRKKSRGPMRKDA